MFIFSDVSSPRPTENKDHANQWSIGCQHELLGEREFSRREKAVPQASRDEAGKNARTITSKTHTRQ